MALTSEQVSSDMDTILSGMVSNEDDFVQSREISYSERVACGVAVKKGYAVALTADRFIALRPTLEGIQYVEGLTTPDEDDG